MIPYESSFEEALSQYPKRRTTNGTTSPPTARSQVEDDCVSVWRTYLPPEITDRALAGGLKPRSPLRDVAVESAELDARVCIRGAPVLRCTIRVSLLVVAMEDGASGDGRNLCAATEFVFLFRQAEVEKLNGRRQRGQVIESLGRARLQAERCPTGQRGHLVHRGSRSLGPARNVPTQPRPRPASSTPGSPQAPFRGAA